MPPKGRSKAKWLHQSNFVEYAKGNSTLEKLKSNFSEKKEVVDDKKKQLQLLHQEEEQLSAQLKEISKQIDLQRHTLAYKHKVHYELENSTSSTKRVTAIRSGFQISSITSKKRKRKPTSLETPHMAKVIRRKETFDACGASYIWHAGHPYKQM